MKTLAVRLQLAAQGLKKGAQQAREEAACAVRDHTPGWERAAQRAAALTIAARDTNGIEGLAEGTEDSHGVEKWLSAMTARILRHVREGEADATTRGLAIAVDVVTRALKDGDA